MTPFAPLNTERLALRPWGPDDAATLHRLLNDFEVCRTLAHVPFPYSRALADAWITEAAEGLAAGTAIHLAVTGPAGEGGQIVGGVGLRLDRDRRAADLGYWVARRFWGHGVASEAAGRLARWALANLDIDRLEAASATDNAGSLAVLRRIGFHHAGEGRDHFLARGQDVPVLRFAANRENLFGADIKPEDGNANAALLLVAACALVDLDGRVLIARRPEGRPMAGLWEFPGGKLKEGETPEAAVIRELHEELGIDITANCLAPFAFASHAYPGFHLLMPLFLCRKWSGIPTPREGQTLAWVLPDRLADYPMPEADRPLVPLLRTFL